MWFKNNIGRDIPLALWSESGKNYLEKLKKKREERLAKQNPSNN